MATDRPEVLAVVPARGGSKGLPRKNVLPLEGRPLIAWSVQAALDASSVTRVIVSTDDDEIAEAAAAAGAEVPFRRPARLAADDTPDLPVFLHALDALAAQGYEPDVVVHLRPTSPVRPAGLVDDAVRLLVEHPEADSVRSVTEPAKTPYKMWRIEDGLLQPLLGGWDDELFNQPRQALPAVWAHDGVLDVVRPAVLRAGSMCGRRVLPLRTPAGCAVDIDDRAGFDEAARLLAAHRRGGGGS